MSIWFGQKAPPVRCADILPGPRTTAERCICATWALRLAALFLVTAPPPALAQECTAGATKWSYEGGTGPKCWGGIEPRKNAKCKDGKQQSPVNIWRSREQPDPETSQKLYGGETAILAQRQNPTRFMRYRAMPLNIEKAHHTLRVYPPDTESLSERLGFWMGMTPYEAFHDGTSYLDPSREKNYFYLLDHIHFHTPSEHTFAGFKLKLEAHFVHKTADGYVGVLAVLFEAGKENPFLKTVLANLPTEPDKPLAPADVTVDPNDLLPASLGVFRYWGSLTTPPCDEKVNWHVLVTRQTATQAQLDAMTNELGDNARPIWPRGARINYSPPPEPAGTGAKKAR